MIEVRQLPNDVAGMREIAEWCGATFVPGVKPYLLLGERRAYVGDFVDRDLCPPVVNYEWFAQ